MKIKSQFLTSVLLAGALLVSTLPATSGSARAQEVGPAPEITPIPWDPANERREVASVNNEAWTPSVSTVFSTTGTTITPTVNVTSQFLLSAASASYRLGGSGDWLGASVVMGGDNKSATLSAAIDVSSGTRTIEFRIKRSEADVFAVSPSHTLQRGSGGGGGGSRKVLLPIVAKEWIQSSIPLDTNLTESNDTPCTAAGSMTSGLTYTGKIGEATTGKPNDTEDWFYIWTQPGQSLQVTVNSFSPPGQLQLFDAASCGTVASLPTTSDADKSTLSASIPRVTNDRVFVRVVLPAMRSTAQPTYSIRASIDANSGLLEDNDNTCQATKTVAGITYTTFADDQYDFFEITVTQSGNVKLLIEGYPVASQLQLRRANNACDPANPADRIGDASFVVNGRAEINAFLSAGVYYARMGPPNPIPTTTSPYRFSWTLTPASAARGTDTCTAFRDCFGNATGAKFTLYWRGMSPNTELRLSYTTERVFNCPAGAPVPGNQTFTVGTGTGQREFTSIPRGFYKLRVLGFENGVQVYTNEHPIKMDCDFASAASVLEDLPPTIGPTPAP
jgi:hypothetical protein